jgi:putative transposase
MTTRRWHATDLTDREWAIIPPLIPPAKPGGRPRSTDPREVLNALSYWLRSGGAWHLLPMISRLGRRCTITGALGG